MTYFETPTAAAAYFLGMSERDYVAMVEDMEAYFEAYTEDPAIDPEDRRFVDESDVFDPDSTIIRGYGGDQRFVVSFGRNDPEPAWN